MNKKHERSRNNSFDFKCNRKLNETKCLKCLKCDFPFVCYYNSFIGTCHLNNEDFLSIHINIFKDSNWPDSHFFSIFDGHGGSKCANFLKENFFSSLMENKNFPKFPIKSLNKTFIQMEQNFFDKFKPNNLLSKLELSGSCAIILLMIGNKFYICNLGDSKIVKSENFLVCNLNKQHKPIFEKNRIEKNGGKIIDNNNQIYRIFPGKLSVSRSFGDLNAKLKEFGGNKNVLITKPEIFVYNFNKNDIDFIVIGSDGLMDFVNEEEIGKIVWKNHKNKENICKILIEKSIENGSKDNISCIFIAFDKFLKYDDEIKKISKEENKFVDKNKYDFNVNYNFRKNNIIIKKNNNFSNNKNNIAKNTSYENYKNSIKEYKLFLNKK